MRTIVLLALLGASSAVIPIAASADAPPVYVIEITGEVDLGLPPYVRRVFEEAAMQRAGAVVLRINTFGGRVDVATQVRDIVLASRIPTIAFVDPRAISAGALITIAADKIVMAPGGTIGAATPVYGDMEKASEKVVSYMRSEMRATAEQNGRDPHIAEAMVDESLALPDSSMKLRGQLLTLTSTEALRVGYCDQEAKTVEEALGVLGLTGSPIIGTSLTWAEQLVRFLTSPMVSSILIMLGLGGLFYAIKTGHLGAIAAVGIGSITLFFGAQYLAELANFIEIAMFVVGVALLMLEIFVIPGFGVAGILGIVMMVASLFLALGGSFDALSFDSLAAPLYTLAASFIGLSIITALMVRYLPSSSAFSRFVLQSPSSVPGTPHVLPEVQALIGAEGQALTTLRPAGVAMLGSERCDVITEGEYIAAGERVRVVRVEGRKVVVRKDAGTAA
jgi:membrane-bound serine protease (ClpP class)